jgi:hypothetical protein
MRRIRQTPGQQRVRYQQVAELVGNPWLRRRTPRQYSQSYNQWSQHGREYARSDAAGAKSTAGKSLAILEGAVNAKYTRIAVGDMLGH